MKFFELRIGAQFEYLGEAYQKVAPFIAVHLASNQQKMFKRSTITTPIETAPPQARKGQKRGQLVPMAAIEQACDIYHQKVAETVSQLHQGTLSLAGVEAALAQAKTTFLDNLSKPE